MEPVSAVLTVAEAFKEAYLLARFVYKTARSTAQYQEEEKSLVAEYEIELLHFRSFWTVFTRADGKLIDDDALNREWLQQISIVVNELGVLFNEYRKIATQNDEDYRQYSPYIANSVPRPLIEFPAETQVVEDAADPEKKPSRTEYWLTKIRGNSHSISESAARVVDGLKWSLHRKEKFEATLAGFKKWSQKLKDLVPYLLESGHWKNEQNLFLRLAGDPIFEPHVRLREIAQNPETAAAQARNLPAIESPLGTTPRQLVEQKFFDSDNPDTEQYVAQLAMLLSTAGSHMFRTLPFKGYLRDEEEPCYNFCFAYPADAADTPPQSLHELIKSQRSGKKATLAARFRIAQALAQSIGAFHSDGWVHKSIRSHAVKFFFSKENPQQINLRLPYLTEFEFSRPESGFTSRAEGDPDLERSVYRHPHRDGPPTIDFNKAHDIYSLGIVLLEIGMWEDAAEIYRTVFKGLEKMSNGLQPSSESVKRGMKSYANRYLPHKMGDAYSQVVDACLSDDFHKKLGMDDFALTFEKGVVEMLDVKRLSD
ncbi:hypothetical protein Daus18300_006475 [Diaporthe australafricana]|uniref:DUF7580 domain-containing protein n=1 Tax=Diaporthe australafricana TaxID=127596 RepID=A0ABR3WTS5_9PEZI